MNYQINISEEVRKSVRQKQPWKDDMTHGEREMILHTHIYIHIYTCMQLQ